MNPAKGASRGPLPDPSAGALARTAVLDLGSTTFQLLVADTDSEGGLTPVLRDRVVLNLGLVLADQGHIPEPVAGRAAETARRLRDVALRAGAERVLPMATSALRDSPNREELAALLEAALGMPVAFIDGGEEARLTFLGVRASVSLPAGTALLLDLGGGSLEVVLGDAQGLQRGLSLPVGAGRLSGRLVAADPPTREERKRVRATVAAAVEPLVATVQAATFTCCIASGGTAGALARLIAAGRWIVPPSSLNQFSMSIAELKDLTRRLGSLSLVSRLRLPGIDERRADLLPVGGLILTAAADAFGVEEVVHSEWGFREGAILDAQSPPPPGLTPDLLRRRSVDRMVRFWGHDPHHLTLVAQVAEAIFERTRALHGLGDAERELLCHAARLHAVGSRISPARLHKHGAYLVEHFGLRGFSPDEVAVIASLIRFQKGKDPRAVYPPFAALPPATRQACLVMVGLLRIAHAIARGPEDESLHVTVAGRGRRLRIELSGVSHPEAVLAEAEEAKSLLERALACSVVFSNHATAPGSRSR